MPSNTMKIVDGIDNVALLNYCSRYMEVLELAGRHDEAAELRTRIRAIQGLKD